MTREDEELQIFVNQVVDIINEKKLYVNNIREILHTPDLEFNELVQRIEWNVRILQAKIKQFDSDNSQAKYQTIMKENLGLDPRDLIHDVVITSLATVTSLFEVTKKFLIKVLDNEAVGIKERDPYGAIISQLSQKLHAEKRLQKQFRKDMMNELRIRLAHEKWKYNENQKFTFNDEDGNLITWDYKELGKEIANFAMIMRYFALAFDTKSQNPSFFQNKTQPKFQNNLSSSHNRLQYCKQQFWLL